MKKRKLVKMNDKGYRIGDSHHKATLTDEQVELIRDLHEEGLVGYRALARQFGVHRDTIAGICQYTRRADTVAKTKTVGMTDSDDGKKQT